jgi:hypothetical protein
MVAAGSVVLCGSALSRADACCVTSALQSALQLDGSPSLPAATFGYAAPQENRGSANYATK